MANAQTRRLAALESCGRVPSGESAPATDAWLKREVAAQEARGIRHEFDPHDEDWQIVTTLLQTAPGENGK